MTYAKSNPRTIRLSELPEKGREFFYSDKTEELNSVVEDLIGQNPFEFRFEIKPIGNAYEMKGEISTELNLACSRCAVDFKHPVKEKFHEIFIVEEARPRASHSTRVNHTSDLTQDGPFCTTLTSDVLDVGEFLHEIIALAEPMQPLGKGSCDETCENYQLAIKEGWFQPEGEAERQSPFSILKHLKI